MSRFIVIVGASGAGKSTLQRAFVQAHPKQYSPVVTCTTRPMRPGEVDGVHYHFLTKEQFVRNRENFAECNQYGGNTYGTPLSECTAGKIAAITPAGLRALRRRGIQLVSVYLKVDRRSRLIKALERGDDIDEAYRRSISEEGRFDGIEQEVDYVLENTGFSLGVKELVRRLEKLLGEEDQEDRRE